MKKFFFIFFLFLVKILAKDSVDLGIDVFFKENHENNIKNKNIALVINHTSLNKNLISTLDVFLSNSKNSLDYKITKIFTPEHGLNGDLYAGQKVENSNLKNIEILSLHGKHKRPTKDVLKNIDVIIFDIQEIGVRSYTYATTLYYILEEANKLGISVIVLDRPNPINGNTFDGPMLDEKYRSFVGYINVPYLHGMTIGELALFFNKEYKIFAKLNVIPMKNWKRDMSFEDTNLHWTPTSPNIPEASSPYFCATTGILGELEIVNIGIGYTLPFKIVGSPWINAKEFSKKLNDQKMPGVKFLPYYFTPFYGLYKNKNCQGIKIVITDKLAYKPVSTSFLILGILKSMYPEKMNEKLKNLSKEKIEFFCKINGKKDIFDFLIIEKYPAWKMINSFEDDLKKFKEVRKKYLLY